MSPVVEMVNILTAVFPNAQVFAYRIPENEQQLENLPIIKIENVAERNSSFGSNKYHSRIYRIQVMAFIDLNSEDIESFNDTLDRTLETNAFFCAYGDTREHEKYKHIQVLTRQYTTTRRK